jgi:hypothetical protein
MTTAATVQPRPRRARLDIPRIRLISWLGLESILWGVVITHIVHWAGNMAYYLAWQMRYSFGPAAEDQPAFSLSAKDFYDRWIVHLQNGLPGEVAFACGLAGAIMIYLLLTRATPGGALSPAGRLYRGACAALAGAGISLWTAYQLRGWHVHWLPSQDVPAWAVTWRHDFRDVGIAFFTTIVVQLMFTKPKHELDDAPTVRQYAAAVPLAIGAALIPISVIGVLAWKLPWLTHHGWQVPASWGAWASEVNGYIEAGEWIAVLMGVLGGLAAKRIVSRIGDDIQWFVAERSVTKLRRETGLDVLRGDRVIGTPAHRLRVRWIQVHRPESPERSPLLIRVFVIGGALIMALAAGGAWLTLLGPAAVH